MYLISPVVDSTTAVPFFGAVTTLTLAGFNGTAGLPLTSFANVFTVTCPPV